MDHKSNLKYHVLSKIVFCCMRKHNLQQSSGRVCLFSLTHI